MNDECQFLIIVESGKYYLYPYYIPKKGKRIAFLFLAIVSI